MYASHSNFETLKIENSTIKMTDCPGFIKKCKNPKRTCFGP